MTSDVASIDGHGDITVICVTFDVRDSRCRCWRADAAVVDRSAASDVTITGWWRQSIEQFAGRQSGLIVRIPLAGWIFAKQTVSTLDALMDAATYGRSLTTMNGSANRSAAGLIRDAADAVYPSPDDVR